MSEMLDDREIRGLLLRAAARDAGSAEAFERLYKLAAPLLLGVAKRIVGRAPRKAAGHGEALGARRHGEPAPVRRALPGRRAMNVAGHRLLDALCGEYLLGTLRGAPRRRFERALREEPPAAARLAHWQTL